MPIKTKDGERVERIAPPRALNLTGDPTPSIPNLMKLPEPVAAPDPGARPKPKKGDTIYVVHRWRSTDNGIRSVISVGRKWVSYGYSADGRVYGRFDVDEWVAGDDVQDEGCDYTIYPSEADYYDTTLANRVWQAFRERLSRRRPSHVGTVGIHDACLSLGIDYDEMVRELDNG